MVTSDAGDLSEAVTVAGGTPTLTLNDGGTATYDAADIDGDCAGVRLHGGGRQNTAALAVTGQRSRPAAPITDGAGNAANLAGADVTFTGLQISNHGADGDGGHGHSGDRRRGRRRQHCDHAGDERGGQRRHHGRHADADAQRRRHGDLRRGEIDGDGAGVRLHGGVH